MSTDPDHYARSVAMATEAGFLELLSTLENNGSLGPTGGRGVMERAIRILSSGQPTEAQIISRGVIENWLSQLERGKESTDVA